MPLPLALAWDLGSFAPSSYASCRHLPSSILAATLPLVAPGTARAVTFARFLSSVVGGGAEQQGGQQGGAAALVAKRLIAGTYQGMD